MKKHEAVKLIHATLKAYIDDNPTHFADNPELLAEIEEAEKLVRQDVILRKPVITEVVLNHNDWKMVLKDGVLTVSKGGESREYTNIPDAVKVEQKNEYVFITHPDTAFTQIKFEDGNFLVIDLFNSQGDLLTDIGSHVFGEDEEEEEIDASLGVETNYGHLEVIPAMIEDDNGTDLHDGVDVRLEGEFIGNVIGGTKYFASVDDLEEWYLKHSDKFSL